MKRPSVLDPRHPPVLQEGETGPREILTDKAVVEFGPADGVKHDARMGEPVTPLSPQVEFDGVEGSAHRGIERVSQRARRLERDTAGTRLHPGKSCGIDLDDTESRIERNRHRVRAGRASADDDEVEVVHTWKIGNGWPRPTPCERPGPIFSSGPNPSGPGAVEPPSRRRWRRAGTPASRRQPCRRTVFRSRRRSDTRAVQ